MSSHEPSDVIIIGAGFSGLYQLHRLRELGFAVTLLEAAPDLGGVWHWNCYPGARVDTHIPNYEFSIEAVWKSWSWRERFPSWQELRAYFAHADAVLDLSKDILFNHRVRSGTFDEANNQWTLHCDNGATVTSRYVVACLGFAAKPYVPELPGLDSFTGPCHHTGLWPQDGLDLTDRHIGIIGTGASGVQVVQEASRVAASVTVFQRTPNIALAMQQRALTQAEQDAAKQDYVDLFKVRNRANGGLHDIKPDPRSALEVTEQERQEVFEAAWQRGGFHFWSGTFAGIMNDPQANRLAYDFWRNKVHARVQNPHTAELLAPAAPHHPFGTKRPSLEQWYYEAFNQDNVKLIDLQTEPIHAVEPDQVRTAQASYPIDVLVLATGFDASTGGLTQIDLRGTHGMNLAQVWRDGVQTFLGVGVPHFPNLLIAYGPQSPTAFWNGPTSAEVQGDWLIRCLSFLREAGHQRIEATETAAVDWTEHMAAMAKASLYSRADSWYMGANIPGKPRQLLHYLRTEKYVEHCERSAAAGYQGFTLS